MISNSGSTTDDLDDNSLLVYYQSIIPGLFAGFAGHAAFAVLEGSTIFVDVVVLIFVVIGNIAMVVVLVLLVTLVVLVVLVVLTVIVHLAVRFDLAVRAALNRE